MLGVDTVDGIDHRRRHASRRHAGSHDHRLPVVRHLRQRDVHGRDGLLGVEAVQLHVAHDPNDFARLVRDQPEGQMLTERVPAVGPEPPRHRLADEDDEWPLRRVGVGEVAAGDNVHPHHAEVPR